MNGNEGEVSILELFLELCSFNAKKTKKKESTCKVPALSARVNSNTPPS